MNTYATVLHSLHSICGLQTSAALRSDPAHEDPAATARPTLSPLVLRALA